MKSKVKSKNEKGSRATTAAQIQPNDASELEVALRKMLSENWVRQISEATKAGMRRRREIRNGR